MSAMRGLRIAAWVVASGERTSSWRSGCSTSAGRWSWIPLWIFPFVALAFLAPAAVGLLIANRQPRNGIAWILLLGALALTLQLPLALALGEGWSLQMERATWPLLYAWPIAVAFVFPNGRLLSRRWRWVAGAAVVSFVGFMAIAHVRPGAVRRRRRRGTRTRWRQRRRGDLARRRRRRGSGSVLWLGILASLFAGAARDHAPASPVERDRAPADDVARLGGRAHPARPAHLRRSPASRSVDRSSTGRLPAAPPDARSRWRLRSGSRSCGTGCTRSSGSSTARSSTCR